MTYFVYWGSMFTVCSEFETKEEAQKFIDEHCGKPHALGTPKLEDIIEGKSVLHEFKHESK